MHALFQSAGFAGFGCNCFAIVLVSCGSFACAFGSSVGGAGSRWRRGFRWCSFGWIGFGLCGFGRGGFAFVAATVGYGAAPAFGRAGFADVAAVQDEPVVGMLHEGFRYAFEQLALYV